MREKETFIERGMIRWTMAIGVALMAFGFVAGMTFPAKRWLTLILLGLFTIIFVKFLDYAGDQLFRYVMGSKGEFKVWVILNEMYRDGFRVINNLELTEKGDIDHVVVGPTGVWVIESKFWNGDFGFVDDKLTRSGKMLEKDPLKQAYAEAVAVRDFLASKGIDVPVRPILVFSGLGARVRFGDAPIKGVYVIGTGFLRKIIGDPRYGKVLNAVQVQKIQTLLEQADV